MAEKEHVVAEKGEATAEQIQEIEEGGFVTPSEIANRLRYSYTWVIDLLKEGRIKGIKPLGGRWRIPKSEFDRLLKEGLPPIPKQTVQEKPPVLEIEVPELVEKKIREEKKAPPAKSLFPFDFGGGNK